MLYQTHHPFFFQFHPLSVTPTTPSLPLLPSSSSPLQVETEMECVETALKSSFRKEMAVKLSPQAFLEESWAVSGKNGGSCDDFFVDGLLDFSNEEDEFVEEKPKPEAGEEEEEKDQENNINCNNGIGFSAKNEFESEPTSELAVPADDLADLEWLSHFVEDSFSEYSAPFPAGIPPVKPKNHPKNRPPITPSVFIKPCFNTPVPAKARSKRTRTGVRVWSLGSASLSDSSSSPTSSSCSSPSSPWLLYSNPNPVCSLEKPVAKKLKRKPAAGEGAGSGGAQPPRRCSHCGVQKTPQWRTGPLGAKTLCNACGVRYKSGRLLPEYRPACSPTFSSQLHSNHHRKVLEMRKKKEVGSDEPGSDLTHPIVPSF